MSLSNKRMQRVLWVSLCAAIGLAGCSVNQDAEIEARLAPVATDDILKDNTLKQDAVAYGRRVYETTCSGCHGADLKGAEGMAMPDLTDDVWLFGGADLDSAGFKIMPSDFEQIVRLGIRTDKSGTRGEGVTMPSFGPGPDKDFALTDEQVGDIVEYVVQLSGRPADAERAARGMALYEGAEGHCYDCHASGGYGDNYIGSTDFTANVWMYGGDREAITASIAEGRNGMCPAHEGMLPDGAIKAVAVYIYSQGKFRDL